nr:RNA polymerase sigma factor [Paenibacillus mangrovi]
MDEALDSIVSGKIDSLQTIYKELRIPVYGLALSILQNKSWAEEIMQETFVRVYEKASNYRHGTNPKAWIISIARNLSYELLRSNIPQRSSFERGISLFKQ